MTPADRTASSRQAQAPAGSAAARAVAGLLAALGVIALVAQRGCYDPSVVSGGFACAPSGKACPDGFTCQAQRCVRPGGAGGRNGGSGGSGAGGDGMCANPIAPLCATLPGGTGCDPVCQNGCPCGLRCSVTGREATCRTPNGAHAAGDLCNAAADDCGPGLICLIEPCGVGVARCYRFCSDNTQCGAGACGVPVADQSGNNTRFRACTLPAATCDPYAGTGCPAQGLSCFVASPGTNLCDCPTDAGNPRREGDTCDNYNDCATGLACIDVGGNRRCHRLCRTAVDCTNCTGFGTGVSFCP